MTPHHLNILLFNCQRSDGSGVYENLLIEYLGLEQEPLIGSAYAMSNLFKPFPEGYDVIHVPHPYVPLRGSGCPIVSTIHDVTPLVVPNLFNVFEKAYYRLRLLETLKRSSQIICCSESTKNDINRIFGEKKNIHVVHHGISYDENEVFGTGATFEPYFFYAGRRKAHKNLLRVLKALSRFDDRYRLIIAGKRTADDESLISLAKVLGISNRLEFTGFITDSQMKHYYFNAAALAFPSLYEGFGFPVLEAMRYGCPVITSPTSSLSEVGGNAVCYVDPYSVDSIVDAFGKVSNDLNYRQELIEKGFVNLKRFSISEMCRKTQDVYCRAMDNG